MVLRDPSVKEKLIVSEHESEIIEMVTPGWVVVDLGEIDAIASMKNEVVGKIFKING